MSKRSIFFFSFLLLIPCAAYSQITGFVDDFEDSSVDTLWNESIHTLWETNFPSTYSISEADGLLNINYSRTTESGLNDDIQFIPPEEVDISQNPKIRVTARSSVTTTLTLRTVFSERRGLVESFSFEVMGDNTFRTYSIEVDPDSFDDFNLQYINFYFDQGTTSNKSGTIEIDRLKVAGFIIKIDSITAETVDGTNIQLNWVSSDPEATGIYKIHRSNEQNFSPSVSNILTATLNPEFLDQGLTAYERHFYRVIPSDTLGEEFFSSAEVSAETFDPAASPSITISSVNSTEIGKYDQFAIEYTLANVGISNPYDPDDIDVHAWFKSPSGDTTWINGFYDDYQNEDQWKLYFSPFETGTWEYQLFVKDTGGKDSTDIASFTAIESGFKGPLKISGSNPNYFEYHNGSPFYGLAIYYPWNVQQVGLNRLQEYGLNMIGYWNGTYDGSGNAGGRYLVESIDSGLGRYDQRKMARIEQILGWLEDRDMKLMYAIWAHPFLRSGAPGWDPIDWPNFNPYQDIVEAEDFFTDSLAWEYQKKQYRYLIARLAHHRALGIWEIINEMHGTTGFDKDQNSAIAWVEKVHEYLKEHDPYQRPTTASFGDANIWNTNNLKTEIVNRHFYETQGYPRPFNDNVRDGLFNVIETYQTMKKKTDRPAMFGEAGYTSMFSDVSSFDYTQEFHNAYWAGLATGMASTPFWWDYTTLSIFPDIRMQVYSNLNSFISHLELTKRVYQPKSADEEGTNIYSMNSDSASFGWLWSYESIDVSETSLHIKNHFTGTYSLAWYNTWDGEDISVDTVIAVDNQLRIQAPTLEEARRDVAYRIHHLENGETATKLKIIILDREIIAAPDSLYTIYVAVTDNSGRLVESADNEIAFSLSGNGSLSENTVSAVNGIAEVVYTPAIDGENFFSITAEASGLTSASLNNQMITNNEDEPGTDLPSEFKLNQNYPNPFNPSTKISYSIPQQGFVSLEIFDIAGRKVSTLVNKVQIAGEHAVDFDASSLSSGVYLYRLKSGIFVQTNRMILLK